MGELEKAINQAKAQPSTINLSETTVPKNKVSPNIGYLPYQKLIFYPIIQHLLVIQRYYIIHIVGMDIH